MIPRGGGPLTGMVYGKMVDILHAQAHPTADYSALPTQALNISISLLISPQKRENQLICTSSTRLAQPKCATPVSPRLGLRVPSFTPQGH